MNGRLIATGLTTLAIASCFAALDTKVTYTTSATSVKAIAEALSKQSGTALAVTPALAKEPLIVRLNGVELQQAMAQIAYAVGGEWAQEGTGYRLLLTPQSLKAQQEAVLKYEAALVQKQLNSIREDVKKMGPYDAQRAKIEFDKERVLVDSIQTSVSNGSGVARREVDSPTSPAAYMLNSILADFDAAAIVGAGPGTRTVYSTAPTAMQRSLPASAVNALTKYVAMHNAYANLAAGAPHDDGEVMIFNGSSTPTVPINAIGKALVSIFRDPNGQFYFINLYVANSEGKIVAESQRSISLSADEAATPEPPKDQSASGTPLALTNDAKAHASLMQYAPTAAPGDIMIMRSRGAGGGQSKTAMIAVTGVSLNGPSAPAPKPMVDKRWKEVLLRPDLYEPLSFEASEYLLRAAESLDCNLVANLDDRAPVIFGSHAATPQNVANILDLLTRTLQSEVKRDIGWLVVRPQLLLRVREERSDRGELATLMQRLDREGRLSLDAISTYAAQRTGYYRPTSFADRHVGLIVSAARPAFLSGVNDTATKLWGTLSGQRRQELLADRNVAMNLLDPRQRELARKLIFDSYDGPNIEMPRPDNGPVNRSVRAMSFGGGQFMMGGMMEWLAQERTEAFAGGIPNDGFLDLQVETEPAVFAVSGAYDDGKVYSAEEYAMYRSIRNNPQLPASDMPGYDKFKMGQRSQLGLNVNLSPRASLSRTLRDYAVDDGAQFVAYEQLPETFKKAVQDASANFRGPKPPVTRF